MNSEQTSSESGAAPAESPAAGGDREVVIITGLSGAGRSTAANALEDIGFFVIDNMPPGLITRVVDLARKADDTTQAHERIAFGCDVREGAFFNELEDALHALSESGVTLRMLFCEASDDVLVRRFEESRRPHPLARDEGVLAGIRREREMLAGLKARADLVIDTSDLSVHDLRARVTGFFREAGEKHPLRVNVQSFGFKHGAPRDADMVLDVRFLPNPHWVEELRPLPGTSEEVREFVLGRPETGEFKQRLFDLLDFLLPHYVAEGKSYLTIAIGCTGGRHRSVVLARETAEHIRERGYAVSVVDRDLK